ncbi:MAG: hypothetical protein ACE5KO_03290 [Candidatus Bathyarchaeia archaeon]
MKGRKSITQTIRLDTMTHQILSAEAGRQRVSFNTLVANLLEDYVEYGRFAKRFKFVRFGPPAIATIFNEFSDDDLTKIGSTLGKKHPREMLAVFGLSFTLENALRLLEYYLPEHAAWFKPPPDIKKEGEVWTIHLRHGINRKWSLFLCEYTTAMFQALQAHKIEPADVQDYSTTLRMTHLNTK